MKFNATQDLFSTLNSYDFPGNEIDDSGYAEPSSEYYPPALLIEACQTLDANGAPPSAQSDVKYVFSRKFRPYSLPLPKYKNISTTIKTLTVTTGYVSTFNYDNVEISNITCNVSHANVVEAEDGNAVAMIADSVNATDYLSSELGMISEISGQTIAYENAKIKNFNALGYDISANSLGATNINSEVMIADTAIFEKLYGGEYKISTELHLTDLKTPIKNVSILYRINSVSQEKAGTTVQFTNGNALDGMAEVQRASLSTPQNTIGTIAGYSTIALQRFADDKNYIETDPAKKQFFSQWSENEYSNGLVAPVSPFGRMTVRTYATTGTSNPIKKFDRLCLFNNNKDKYRGVLGKINSTTSPEDIVAIALEENKKGFKDIECLIDFRGRAP